MILSPFAKPGRFLKGNLHTHTNRSDGALPLDEVIRRYRSAGYDFCAITDHFLKEFSFPVVDTRSFRDTGFTTLIGAELHAPRTEMSSIWHIVAVGLPLDFAPTGETETGVDLARRAKAAGAFIGIAHPAWYQLSLADAESMVPHAHAVEIYNHGCQVMHDRGDGAYMLDGLCDKGHRLLTYACDDAHFHAPDLGGGWVMVKAQDHNPDVILAALKAGDFYSTQGPLINHVEITDTEIIVECTPAKGILVNGAGYQQVYKYESGITYARLSREKLAKTPWCRVVVVGEDGKRAWTSPIWDETN